MPVMRTIQRIVAVIGAGMVMLALPALASAAPPICPTTIMDADLPCDITLPGTYTISALALPHETDPSAPGDAVIRIRASGVIIDGGGNTLTYCDTQKSSGIRGGSGIGNVEIRNLTLQQGGFHPLGGNGCNGIVHDGAGNNWNIHNNIVNITDSGSDASTTTVAIAIVGFGFNVTGETIANNTINITDNDPDVPFTTTAGTDPCGCTPVGCTCTVADGSGARGISIQNAGGGQTFEGVIDNNTIVMDKQTNLVAGRPNAIELFVPAGPNGARATNNHITLGATSYQVQGIVLNIASGWEIGPGNTCTDNSLHSRCIIMDGSDNNSIHDNTITMNVPVPAGPGRESSSGMTLRSGSDNNIVFNNQFLAGGSDPNALVQGLSLGGREGPGPVGTGSLQKNTDPVGNVFKKNDVEVRRDALVIQASSNHRLYQNTFKILGPSGQGRPVLIQEDTLGNPSNIVFSGDTFTTLGPGTTACGGNNPNCAVEMQAAAVGIGQPKQICFANVTLNGAPLNPTPLIGDFSQGSGTYNFTTNSAACTVCSTPSCAPPGDAAPNSPLNVTSP